MALTLDEAAKLSNDMLLQGVVETIVKDSPVLRQMPFIEIVGNVLTYNQEKTLPAKHEDLTATVQLAGSHKVYLEGVAVARNLPAAEMALGRRVAVIFFDEHNARDAVVIAVYT
jgi:hypothetical protein